MVLYHRIAMRNLVEGRAALVTGGGSGIGRATALLLAEEGARVAVLDIDGEHAEQVATEVSQAGGQAIAIQADVADPAAITRAVQTAAEQMGGLHILVNNAGIPAGPRIPSEEVALDHWEKLMRVDFWAYLLFAREALPWLTREGGVFVNNASSVAISSAPLAAPYTTAKAAVVMLTRQLAAEWGPRGIRVNAVAPGIINTGFGRPAELRNVVDPALQARHERYIPLRREGTALDIARVILFLCSDLAGYVTGQNILIDGGLLDMVYPMVNDV